MSTSCACAARQLQAWADQPLLLCADVEEGVGQRFEGASWLVPPLALGRLHRRDPELALDLAERYGHCTGREARLRRAQLGAGAGVRCEQQPRQPGDQRARLGRRTRARLAPWRPPSAGLQSAGVLGCAKHFPGHGDTSSDSHLELPVMPHSRERLEAMELPPFRASDRGRGGRGDDGPPAAASPRSPAAGHPVERGAHHLLRRDLGFGGLVVTDALVMEAITRHYGAAEAAVLALEAGADLVLMPADAHAAIEGSSPAVASGRIATAAAGAERGGGVPPGQLQGGRGDPGLDGDPLTAAQPDRPWSRCWWSAPWSNGAAAGPVAAA